MKRNATQALLITTLTVGAVSLMGLGCSDSSDASDREAEAGAPAAGMGVGAEGGNRASGGQRSADGGQPDSAPTGGKHVTGGRSSDDGGQGGSAQGGGVTGELASAEGGKPDAETGGTGAASAAGAPQSTLPTGACRNTRLTTYEDNNERLGCGYLRALPVIPRLVRDRMYFAMNEPFYGSSYEGSPGEACGECWELTTTTATTTVIVADLCPIEGNPPCADPDQMNFDMVDTAAAQVGSQGYDQAVARPVACPVNGTIQLEVTDRSWAYFQAAFFEHRVPLRLVEFQPEGSTTWTEMTRRWGAVWDNMDSQDAAFVTLAAGAGSDGAGVRLRLTSAQGQVVTSTALLDASNSAVGMTVDLRIQFDNQLGVAGDTCEL